MAGRYGAGYTASVHPLGRGVRPELPATPTPRWATARCYARSAAAGTGVTVLLGCLGSPALLTLLASEPAGGGSGQPTHRLAWDFHPHHAGQWLDPNAPGKCWIPGPASTAWLRVCFDLASLSSTGYRKPVNGTCVPQRMREVPLVAQPRWRTAQG